MTGMYALRDIMNANYPAAVFYIFYGIFLVVLKFRLNIKRPFVSLIIIAMSDMSANIIEVIVRDEFKVGQLEIIIGSLLLTGVVRASIGYLMYLSEKFYSVLLESKQQKEKYKEFVMMRANIRTEIFFMRKSMDDIEESMKASFGLYKELSAMDQGIPLENIPTIRSKVLNISKGIHEVKKDYLRIIAGIGNVLPDYHIDPYKMSTEIFELITEVTEKYIDKTSKRIDFKIKTESEFPIFEYSALISILNNLIVNAIDSVEKNGKINIDVKECVDTINFLVSDNGNGIKEKNLQAIFNPGFSTKFDKRTGKMSTGIGLTHVKHIIERFFDGEIEVQSTHLLGTTFIVKIPKVKLCVGGEKHE